jgi:hypothetical protein
MLRVAVDRVRFQVDRYSDQSPVHHGKDLQELHDRGSQGRSPEGQADGDGGKAKALTVPNTMFLYLLFSLLRYSPNANIEVLSSHLGLSSE